MRDVVLEELTISGFKSYVEPTTIVFTTGAGLKFIGGRNRVEPRLGANGAGKSSMWDALNWCLYGTSTRGARASVLVPLDAERADVAARLLIGSTGHSVRRTSHPERIEIDGKQASQTDVNRLMGLSRDAFMQSVLFGQAVPLFYDLSVPERGALLETVLELEFWSETSAVAAEEERSLTAKITEAERRMSYVRGRMAELPKREELEHKEKQWRADIEEQITRIADRMEKIEREQRIAEREVRDLREEAAIPDSEDAEHLSALEKDRDDLRFVIREHEVHLRDAERMAEFYAHKTTCPTCGQAIDQKFIGKRLGELEREITGTKKSIKAAQKQLDAVLSSVRGIVDAANEKVVVIRKLREAERAVEQLNGDLINLEKQGEQLLNVRDDNNPFAKEIEEADEKRRDYQSELRRMMSEFGKLDAEFRRVNYWRSTGFKRMRLFQMTRALRRLELEANNAANALGLVGWQIQFRTEVETRSGGQRHGVQIIVNRAGEDKAREWSPGELQRVRLAIAFGLAHMIQQMSGVAYRWEVFDEPSNWLSSEGIEDLIEQLRYRADITNRSIWLLDHRSFNASFDEIWEVEKTTAGSNVRMLSGAQMQ